MSKSADKPVRKSVRKSADDEKLKVSESILKTAEEMISVPVSASVYGHGHMRAYGKIGDFEVRPGFYEINGATAIPGGVNFTISSHQATYCELLLFGRKEKIPYAVLPFPKEYRIGNVWSMIVFGLDIEEFEYAYRFDGPYDPAKGLLFDKTKVILDPYARAVTGQHIWGAKRSGFYTARVVRNDFDWGVQGNSNNQMEDLIIYEMHVRGFTQAGSSGVEHNGTFSGIIEKLPYLERLGVTALELMPVFEFDENLAHRDFYGRNLIDYWGYNTVCFFAPNTGYASENEYNREGSQLKNLIRECHDRGIDVLLDVVFNHTAEGDERGPAFSFKGIDNNIYYMLTPDGKYYNFSGCGNTLNCNHPIVQRLILDCLRYWVTVYHVDGFRFDLAAILGRNEDGSPMSKPPLLQSLAFDPILGGVKLIAEAWDAGGLYQVGTFPSWNRWAEWNGRYRDDMRSFLKGDAGFADAAAKRIMGSPDIYMPEIRGSRASVNFIDCHDGFTLHDLYTYDRKHNEENNWNNTDGADDNRSWNCGVEGETSDPEINRLRRRMEENAIAVLMLSRGTPMFFMGDEFGNSQGGNNNAYCQDNFIAWLNWEDLNRNSDLFDFFRFVINFRKAHDCIKMKCREGAFGFPEMSAHDVEPWSCDYKDYSHFVGVMFSGTNEKTGEPQAVYLAVNTYWEPLSIHIPELPEGCGYHWRRVVDTYERDPLAGWIDDEGTPADESDFEGHKDNSRWYIRERTVIVFDAVKD